MARRRRTTGRFRDPEFITPKLGAELSQYGDHTGFRNEPRWHMEAEISMLGGLLNPVEAFMAIRGKPPRPDLNPQVRHFAVQRLVQGEFTVEATPTRNIPGHASVSAPTKVEDPQGWWANTGRGRLEVLVACTHAITDKEVSGCAL